MAAAMIETALQQIHAGHAGLATTEAGHAPDKVWTRLLTDACRLAWRGVDLLQRAVRDRNKLNLARENSRRKNDIEMIKARTRDREAAARNGLPDPFADTVRDYDALGPLPPPVVEAPAPPEGWRDLIVMDYAVNDAFPIIKGTTIVVDEALWMIHDHWALNDIRKVFPEMEGWHLALLRAAWYEDLGGPENRDRFIHYPRPCPLPEIDYGPGIRNPALPPKGQPVSKFRRR
jgi:hypothetical protein